MSKNLRNDGNQLNGINFITTAWEGKRRYSGYFQNKNEIFEIQINYTNFQQYLEKKLID